MLVGASMGADDISRWTGRLAGNTWMRIFPSNQTINGKALKVLPLWTDSRFAYCQANNVKPFVSSKVDGDPDGIAYVRDQLVNMPAWVTTLYITDRHEPEGDAGLTADTFKANFKAFYLMIEGLPTATRAKIKCGPVLTKTWTEDASKGNFDYSKYDPISIGYGGDFFGVDMYVMSSSGPSGSVVTPATLPTAVAFTQTFKGYRYNTGDTRPRCFPEIGVVGMPADETGTARANWIQAVHNELKTWTQATRGWPWLGWIWWNQTGKATGNVPGIGDRRDFPLDLRTIGSGTAEDPYRAVTLPGNPPPPVATYNSIWTAENASEPPPTPPPTPPPGTPAPPGANSGLPTNLPDAARLLAADYVLLITDRNLNVLGDPIIDWTTLDVTLRFNQPGSGQFTVPGYRRIRDTLIPGARVVCIRRAVDKASVVLAGPIESTLYERSDDGDKSGDGVLRVTWADDMAWVAGRLSYPNPALAPSAQTTDNWRWNGNAELGMRALVDGNAGPTALAARRVPRLALGTLSGVGTSIVMGTANTTNPADPTAQSTRFQPVTDVLRDMARKGGGLGFRTVQSMAGKQILFEVYAPRDMTRQVRFGFGLGNLKYIGYEVTMPEVTTAIVGGQGDEINGADRFVLERNNTVAESAWGRLETLVSRPGNDPVAELNEAGDEELADNGEGVRLASNAADTVDQRFEVHYSIGDKVSIEVYPGQAISDIVQTVHIQAWPTAGEVVGITIGSQATQHDTAWIKRLRAMDRRVGRLERNI